MKEPTRLMQGGGPARELMQGSLLRVPADARKRALQFTGVAVGVTASGTAAAAAGATSIVKSLVLTVTLGAVGGGLVSLGVSRAFSRFEAASPQASARPAPRASAVRGGPAAPAPVAVETPPAVPTAEPVIEPPPVVASAAPDVRALPSKPKSDAPFEAPPSASVGDFRDVPRQSSLVEEQRVIEAARVAVAHGDAQGALATLDGYDRRYAQKQFGPEALALRVQALAATGQLGPARALAKDFELRYPHHPLLRRVQSVVAR